MNNEEEAKVLLTLACPTNLDGKHIAPELADKQNIENLNAFGDRLESIYNNWLDNRKGRTLMEVFEEEAAVQGAE